MGEKEVVNVETASLNITMSIDNEIYLVAMEREKLEAVTAVIKQATYSVVQTGVTQGEFNKLLGYSK